MRYFLGIIFYCFLNSSIAQTCCSGGVPMSSNLGFMQKDQGTLQINFTADFNILKSLFAESEMLTDDLRTRTTQSYITRVAYAIHPKWQIETFIPFVRQTRSIIGNSGIEDFQSSFGFGDPVILLTYSLLNQMHQLRLGIGPQMPLGSFDEKNERGLFLVEDLQPGSGAWDFVLFGNYQTSFKNRPSSVLFMNVIYNANGINNESRGGQQTYRFGNEIQIISGLSDQFIFFNQIIQPGIAFRYRSAQRDKVDDFPNSGTGGHFIFLRLSNSIQFPQNSISFLVELPISRFVNETQLAPTLSFNIGWNTQLNLKKSPSQIIDI